MTDIAQSLLLTDVLEEEIHPGLLDGVTFLHLDSRNTR